jgi:hypothetical protein
MKAAIVILSDPKSGSDEALGRLANGLAAAYDFKNRGQEVSVQFQGPGTRWVSVLNKSDHPMHNLFEAVKDKVVGVSCGCSDVFGARAEAESGGYALLTENAVPGTSGLPSLSRLISEGFTVLTF